MNRKREISKTKYSFAAVAAAVILTAAISAQAALVGHWVSGAESLSDSSGFTAAGTHDGFAIGANAGAIAFSTDRPTGATGKSLDLRAGNVGLEVSNSATNDTGYVNTFDSGISSQITVAFWAKGIPTTWAPWVCKYGEGTIGWQMRRNGGNPVACFTIRGLDDADGNGSTINVNDIPAVWRHFAGTWNKATGIRTLYVDGQFSHTDINPTTQNMNLAAGHHLAIGAKQNGAATGYEAYFNGLLYDVQIHNSALTQNEIMALILLPPADLTAFPLNDRTQLEWADSPTTATGYNVSVSNTVTAAVEIRTDVTSPYVFTGLSNGTLYHCRIQSVNSVAASAFSAPVAVTPAIGTGNSIVAFNFGALGAASIRGTNVIKNVPASTDVTTLAPTYTVSPGATGDPVKTSGSTLDFTTPLVYTITADDGTPTNYLVTVIQTAATTYDFNTGMQGWTQLFPTNGIDFVWANNALGSGHDEGETRFARSPEFYLNNLGNLTFDLQGGQSTQADPVAPDQIPELSITNRDGGLGGFAGAALRDAASNTYVMWRRRSGSADPWQPQMFTAAELAPYANDGKKYTLDYIDYNRGGWGWTYMDNVSIPGTLVIPLMTSFTHPPFDPAIIVGTNITLRVTFGYNLATLTPSYTFTPGAPFAFGTPASGATVDFSAGSVAYTLVSSDLAVTNIYNVTAVVMADPATALVGHWFSFAETLEDKANFVADGRHDGIVAGTAAALAYSADTPPGFAGSSLNLSAGGVGVRIANSRTNDLNYVQTFDEGLTNQFTVTFWAKGFPLRWNPWVAKRGDPVNGTAEGWQLRRFDISDNPCFTLRGVDNEDGPGATVNVNDNEWRHYAGVWDQSAGKRTLYVNGAIANVTYNTIGQNMRLSPGQALTIGARADGGNGYQSYFGGKLYDVRIYKQALFSNQVHTVMTTPTEVQLPEAKLKSFGIPGNEALIDQTTGVITWVFPFGTDLTALAPVFTISPGATCTRVSGTTDNFTMVQSYTVTSSDSLIVKTYTTKVVIGFNFNDGTLQGWNNRVWDTNANSQAGAWVDLPPNMTTMPGTVNGGVIVPASAENGLFINQNGAVWISGHIDNHLNTHWLRSPAFYLNRSGDLTVRLAQGTSRNPVPPASEADIPMEAAHNAGWMGVAIRRVSTDSFVLVKPKTVGNSGVYYTFTFTAEELKQLSSYEPYTLELINADRGSWGWMTMDDVIVPGNSTQSILPGTMLILR